MRIKNPFGFISALVPLFTASVVFLSGCGSNGSSTPSSASAPSDKSSRLITAAKGGSIIAEDENGLKATLYIPANTLIEDTDIRLSIRQNQNGISVSALPDNLMLLDRAFITLEFLKNPENFTGLRIFDENREGSLRPLKQFQNNNKIKGSIYILGEFRLILPDDGLILEIADNEKNIVPSSKWQELATSFNALVWISAYYKEMGEPEEAIACVEKAIEKSKEGAGIFINSDLSSKKEDINALEKLKYLMGLCQNPDNIKEKIEEKFDSISS